MIEVKKEFIESENQTLKITGIQRKEKRDFKGVWIKKEIWLDNNITWMEKLFLVEIDSLDNDNGCFASNNHFSEFFNLSASRCSEIISSLTKKQYISAVFERKDCKIVKRILKVINNTSSRNTENPFGKGGEPPSEKAEGINTLINNTSNISLSDELPPTKAKTNKKEVKTYFEDNAKMNGIIESYCSIYEEFTEQKLIITGKEVGAIQKIVTLLHDKSKLSYERLIDVFHALERCSFFYDPVVKVWQRLPAPSLVLSQINQLRGL
jgi:hypothetical protein